MRIPKIILAIIFCFTVLQSFAQNGEGVVGKYHAFAVYAGAGPSYFFNNLVIQKDYVQSFKYAISARVMWEPEHSFVSIGIETGYFRLYSVKSTKPRADITNSTIPLQFVVGMKFSQKFYAAWAMGQSFTINKVSNTDSNYNFNNTVASLADFSATIGYKFVVKPKVSYAAEIKGFYSSKYENATIALLFIVGFRL